jgi:hypothetical protein
MGINRLDKKMGRTKNARPSVYAACVGARVASRHCPLLRAGAATVKQPENPGNIFYRSGEKRASKKNFVIKNNLNPEKISEPLVA